MRNSLTPSCNSRVANPSSPSRSTLAVQGRGKTPLQNSWQNYEGVGSWRRPHGPGQLRGTLPFRFPRPRSALIRSHSSIVFPIGSPPAIGERSVPMAPLSLKLTRVQYLRMDGDANEEQYFPELVRGGNPSWAAILLRQERCPTGVHAPDWCHA